MEPQANMVITFVATVVKGKPSEGYNFHSIAAIQPKLSTEASELLLKVPQMAPMTLLGRENLSIPSQKDIQQAQRDIQLFLKDSTVSEPLCSIN